MSQHPLELVERTVPGLHDFILREVILPSLRHAAKVCDLGAGSGAVAVRVQSLSAAPPCECWHPTIV